MRRTRAIALCGAAAGIVHLVAVLSAAGQVVERIPVQGDLLRVDTRRPASGHAVTLKASKEIVTSFPHDPTQEPSQLLIVWGDGPTERTALITLDPASWSPLGTPPGIRGYRYRDPSASRGGVKRIVYKQAPKHRRLRLVARGDAWPWEFGGSSAAVRVEFRIGDRRLCAEFGGVVKRDGTGLFLARGAPEPAACPTQTCGNGLVEEPEACDDGNLDPDDGCANDCSVPTAVACTGLGFDPGLDPGPYSLIDLHTHCAEATSCAAENVDSLMDGEMAVVTSSLQHWAITATLGDPIPPGAELFAVQNQTNRQTADRSSQVFFLASLECLSEVAASDSGWLAECLADADQWLAAGARGFKDHGGATYGQNDADPARWVGAYNRLAGWCSPPGMSTAPNRDCLLEPGVRFPVAQPEWRALVRELVEVRGVPLLTHAVPWYDSPELCNTGGTLEPCPQAALSAFLDFASWAEQNLTPQARRRIILAHAGYLQNDLPSLQQILDAGLTVDLAQAAVLPNAGCILRQFVASHPTQVVLGTDITVGRACAEATYEAWCHGMLGPAGQSRSFGGTCYGTMQTTGAALGHPDPGVCGTALSPDAGERAVWKNAAEILGLP